MFRHPIELPDLARHLHEPFGVGFLKRVRKRRASTALRGFANQQRIKQLLGFRVRLKVRDSSADWQYSQSAVSQPCRGFPIRGRTTFNTPGRIDALPNRIRRYSRFRNLRYTSEY
jgi:hypothetical protein